MDPLGMLETQITSLTEMIDETTNFLDRLRNQYKTLIRNANTGEQKDILLEEFKKELTTWINYLTSLEIKKMNLEATKLRLTA